MELPKDKPHALWFQLALLSEMQRAIIQPDLYTLKERNELLKAHEALTSIVESLKQRGVYTGMTEVA